MITAMKYYRLALKWWLADHAAPMLILGALLLTLGLAQLGRALVPQRATLVIAATATPPLAPLATPTMLADGLPRAVTAYAAPDGLVLGAIEPGRPYRVMARAGSEWLQLSVRDSGLVWVRAAEAGLLASPELADLAPPPPSTPQVIVVERQVPVTVVVPAEVPAEVPVAAPAAGPDVRTLLIAPATPTPGGCVAAPGGGETCSGTW